MNEAYTYMYLRSAFVPQHKYIKYTRILHCLLATYNVHVVPQLSRIHPSSFVCNLKCTIGNRAATCICRRWEKEEEGKSRTKTTHTLPHSLLSSYLQLRREYVTAISPSQTPSTGHQSLCLSGGAT